MARNPPKSNCQHAQNLSRKGVIFGVNYTTPCTVLHVLNCFRVSICSWSMFPNETRALNAPGSTDIQHTGDRQQVQMPQGATSRVPQLGKAARVSKPLVMEREAPSDLAWIGTMELGSLRVARGWIRWACKCYWEAPKPSEHCITFFKCNSLLISGLWKLMETFLLLVQHKRNQKSFVFVAFCNTTTCFLLTSANLVCLDQKAFRTGAVLPITVFCPAPCTGKLQLNRDREALLWHGWLIMPTMKKRAIFEEAKIRTCM